MRIGGAELPLGLTRALRRWRRNAIAIVQTGLAAGLAWIVAVDVVGHPRPFFAPVAAVVCIGVALGVRLRRVVELVVGVSVGIGVGDLLITAIGSGPWQIALVVMLAMSTAVLVDGGTMIALQAGSSAVLVATLLPPSQGLGLARMEDALVGGLVGLVVTALLPANPITVAHRHGRVVLGELAALLRDVATAVDEQDVVKAAHALSRARATQAAVNEFRTALQTSAEIAMIAPIHWRHRTELGRYAAAADPVDRALRNTRVLARRAVAAVRDSETIPDLLPKVLRQFADAVDVLQTELARAQEPRAARDAVAAASTAVTEELAKDGGGFSVRVVVAQLRSISVDLLQATGVGRDDALAVLPPLGHDDMP